jgi:hypothetical protein
MGRFGTLIGLFVCALGSAQQARALSAECTEPLSSASDARPERPQLSPASMPVAYAPSAPLPLGGEDESELPWCVSPEDPRCSPLPGHSTPNQLALGSFVLASAVLDPPAPWALHAAQRLPARGLSPARGVRDRLERPPRSTRRPL